jgi:hypothetical protein
MRNDFGSDDRILLNSKDPNFLLLPEDDKQERIRLKTLLCNLQLYIRQIDAASYNIVEMPFAQDNVDASYIQMRHYKGLILKAREKDREFVDNFLRHHNNTSKQLHRDWNLIQ